MLVPFGLEQINNFVAILPYRLREYEVAGRAAGLKCRVLAAYRMADDVERRLGKESD